MCRQPAVTFRRALRLALPAAVTLLCLLLGEVASADRPAGVTAQTVKAGSGATSLKGLGESFSPNLSTGTGSYSVGIEVPPGFLQPSLSLQYAGGSGKGPIGMGWDMPMLHVYRSTDKGAPDFDGEDRFSVAGGGINDELVRVDAEQGLYRLKNEGAFVLFERDTLHDEWIAHFPSGERAILGASGEARQTSRGRTYKWFVSRREDLFGHFTAYDYLRDDGRVYIDAIRYQQHAAAVFQNRVQFQYESRPDAFTDYSYGEACSTRLRLRSIDVYHGSRLLRSYALGYETGLLFSRLRSVHMTAGQLAMPTLRFGYVADSREGGELVGFDSGPPLEGLGNGLAELDDVNGDGLPDLIYGVANDYHYYPNLDGRRFATTAVQLAGSPDRHLFEPGVAFTDMDGDGFRDLVHPQGERFRYYPAGRIENGVVRGFEAPVEVETQAGGFHFTSPDTKMSDLNSDGRIDLIWQKPGRDAVLLNIDDALVERSIEELPADIDFRDRRLQLADFNGDGELDFVLNRLGLEDSRVSVWFGLGQGRYTAEHAMGNVPFGDPGEFHFDDVNRDGQTDLVRVSGSWATYYLNDGDLRYTNKRGDFHGLPAQSGTRRLLFADMNGNGSRDVVWYTTGDELLYLDLMDRPDAGLLSRIDNGMGWVTSLEYRSSTSYAVEAREAGRPWKHPLRSPVAVLSELRTTDSFDRLGLKPTETRTTYEYRDGYYDGKEREFRGFGHVLVTEDGDDHHDARTTETFMHVGRNPHNGEDEEILKGKPYRLLMRNGAGELLSSTETVWERRWMCQEDLAGVTRQVLPRCNRFANLDEAKDELVAFAQQPLVLQSAWEGNHEGRYTATQVEYDAWGNSERTTSFGEVGIAGGHRPGEPFAVELFDVHVGDDESVVETEIIYDVERWIIGKPFLERKRELGGRVLSTTRTLFDGAEPYRGLPAGQVERGLVTQSQAWLAEQSRWVNVTRNRYNQHGKVSASLDAADNEVQLEYDDTGTFAILERAFVEAGPVEFGGVYDTAFGHIVRATDANGITTQVHYDDLGRLTHVVGPEDTYDRPLARYTYTYGTPESPFSVTTTDTLIDRAGTGTYRRTYAYSDGAGVARQSKTEADDGYIVEGWVDKTARGAVARKFQRFASDYPGLEEPSRDVPFVEGFYDAMGRQTHQYSPATEDLPRTYVQTDYLPLETRVYNEEETNEGRWLHPVISRLDGQGRVREVEKTNSRDGVLQRLVWRHDYDAAGRLVSIADPNWSPDANSPNHSDRYRRHYYYDSVGRQTSLRDPNMGLVEFTYNDMGNLLARTDALGQRVEWEYGLANRPRERRATNHTDGSRDVVYRYHYDEPDAEGPLASGENLLGRLAYVEYPTGSDHYAYDIYGREVETARLLWNPVLSNFDEQSRDVFRSKVKSFSADDLPQHTEGPGGLELHYEYNGRRLAERITASFGGTTKAVASGLRYDQRGLLIAADHGNGTRTCRTYNSRQQLTSTVTAAVEDVTCGRPAPSGVGVQNLRYERGYNGQLSAIRDRSADLGQPGRLDASYRYDSIGQLVFASNHVATLKFEYDRIQNLVSRDLLAGVTAAATGPFLYGEGDAGPSMLTHAAGQDYAYDAIGQLQRVNGYDLSFDAEGLLVSASSDSRAVDFHYDAWGQRAMGIASEAGGPSRVHRYVSASYEVRQLAHTTGDTQTDEIFRVGAGASTTEIRRSDGVDVDAVLLNQLSALVPEEGVAPQDPALRPLPIEYMDLDGDGDWFDQDDLEVALTAFTNGRQAGGTRDVWSYHHGDQLGGTTHVTDSTGQLVTFQSFHPFGSSALRSGRAASVGYAGSAQAIDSELGLVYFGSRYYAPKLGRWISPDRHIGDSAEKMAATPLESSLFNYAANNPIGRADPSGQSSEAASFDEAAAAVGEGAMVIGGAVLSGAQQAAVDAVRDKVIKALVGGPLAAAYAGYEIGKAIAENWDAITRAVENLGDQLGSVSAWMDRLVSGEGTATDWKVVGMVATVVAIGVVVPKLVGKAANKLQSIKLGRGAPKGGRGPATDWDGFDESLAGGPVRNLSTNGVRVSDRGIAVVERHTARFGPDRANSAMIERLRKISKGEIEATPQDMNFYTHELREFVRYRKRGYADGLPEGSEAQRQLWLQTHSASLDDYGLPLRRDDLLYTPEIQPMLYDLD